MSKIYVFGHKNPDSDTICSALAYAELKKALGFDAVAMKLGELSNETKFILKYFDVDEPETLSTIRTQVSDLQIDEAVCVPPSVTVHAAWQLLKKQRKKTLVVVNESKELVGFATISDIAKNFMDVNDDVLATSETPYQNIIDTLNAEVVCGTPDKHVAKGQILIAAQWHSKVGRYVSKGDIVIASIRENIREAILSGAQLVICTCGSCPAEADIKLAEENHCDIIATDYDTFITAILIRQSIPI
jgi:manganese-dependent inorganic pyrophosphatase